MPDDLEQHEACPVSCVAFSGIGISSRTMGTVHASSDYDIKRLGMSP